MDKASEKGSEQAVGRQPARDADAAVASTPDTTAPHTSSATQTTPSVPEAAQRGDTLHKQVSRRPTNKQQSNPFGSTGLGVAGLGLSEEMERAFGISKHREDVQEEKTSAKGRSTQSVARRPSRKRSKQQEQEEEVDKANIVKEIELDHGEVDSNFKAQLYQFKIDKACDTCQPLAKRWADMRKARTYTIQDVEAFLKWGNGEIVAFIKNTPLYPYIPEECRSLDGVRGRGWNGDHTS